MTCTTPEVNLVSDGARRFCYDLENRLLRVDDASDVSCSTPSLTLSYDPLGRLHEASDGSVTRQFLYDGDALIAEYDASSISLRFVHGPGVDEPVVQYEGPDLNTRIHLFADRQGSIIAANGAATTTYRYGPYGETDNWSGSRFRYTGQIVLDPDLGASAPVRLYHYKARVFDPVEGRFLQTDPVGYDDDLNLYQYVSNSPLSATDPTGTQEQEQDDTYQPFNPLVFLNDLFVANTQRLLGRCHNSATCQRMYPEASLSESAGDPPAPGGRRPTDTAGTPQGPDDPDAEGPTRRVQLSGNWRPRSVAEACQTDCSQVAREIHRLRGGTIYRIQPKYGRFLGRFRGESTNGWQYHDVVVRDGRVYDLTTGGRGLPIDGYKALWQFSDELLFGF